MADNKIYSATYSGVQVYETVVKDVVVMRRRNDSYMNATQILKVAGIEKGKRTKILEREVLPGEHEKVQGGYGKFQGTWIPLDKGRELAERYNVLEVLKCILDFQPPSGVGEDDDQLPTKEQAVAAQRKLNNQQQQRNARASSNRQTPSTSAAAATTPASPYYPGSPLSAAGSPIHKATTPSRREEHHHHHPIQRKKQKTASSSAAAAPSNGSIAGSPQPHRQQYQPHQHSMPRPSSDEHRNLLMAIFLSDDSDHIPELLQSPSPNFDIDLVIDEQGNTGLHWATALARVTIVQLLVSKGANPACANYAGETPLMRSVMVTNSFDNNTFPTILSALSSTLTAVDQKKRSVLHHAALTSGIHGRTQAAIYYMHHLLHAISSYPAAAPILDWQDDRGDTALNIAAQLECSETVKLLTRAGATKTTENNVGLSSVDYTPSSPNETQESTTEEQQLQQKLPVEPSERGREIVTTVQKIVDALDEEYGSQLSQRDQELKTIQDELEAATKELEATRKALEAKQTQSQQLVEAQQKIRNLQMALQGEWDGISTTLPANNTTAIDEIDEKQDIDALFLPSTPENSQGNANISRAHKLEHQIKLLESRITSYTQNDNDLRAELEGLKAQSAEKELQCKRLIAACCSLPIEKIDDLVEPLTLAIESDPPDLDLARVIGFMEKIRRQGAFSEGLPSTSSPSAPSPMPFSAPSFATPTNAAATAASVAPTSSSTTYESEHPPSSQISEGPSGETPRPPSVVTTPVN
ncbi:hypothetical protein BDB00DRAFT_799368 [Zychaea mexicana]|uniref:uncharacterized protein n=1 Tax=Zychaea mexicana TaxID=64656 RepID=UPI0022FE29AC|nr:uncharacterized protein BDB00DRAFT_799368 [Zychaea mexicana]KAI9498752.1 hypothetical protein BDB00DRAFT_799368 [Zychaea mexicana]